MHKFIRKSSKYNLIHFYIYVGESFFNIFIRRPWYRKKRFVIPICFFMAMLIGAAIFGGIIGSRSAANSKGKTFLPKVIIMQARSYKGRR